MFRLLLVSIMCLGVSGCLEEKHPAAHMVGKEVRVDILGGGVDGTLISINDKGALVKRAHGRQTFIANNAGFKVKCLSDCY